MIVEYLPINIDIIIKKTISLNKDNQVRADSQSQSLPLNAKRQEASSQKIAKKEPLKPKFLQRQPHERPLIPIPIPLTTLIAEHVRQRLDVTTGRTGDRASEGDHLQRQRGVSCRDEDQRGYHRGGGGRGRGVLCYAFQETTL